MLRSHFNWVWIAALTGRCLKTFQHKGLWKWQKSWCGIRAVLCGSVITSMSPHTEQHSEVQKPPTHHLSSAKLAFGSVMSEMLDSSSAGSFSPFFFTPLATCQLPYCRCGVRRGLSPCRTLPGPCSSFPVAACHLHAPYPITFSFSVSSFPSHFLCMFFKQAKGASWWPARAALWLSHSSWITAASFTLFHFLSSRSSASLPLFRLILQSVSLSVSQGPPL